MLCIAWRSGVELSRSNGKSRLPASISGFSAGRFDGDEQGGDVHYVTLCGGGVITRIVVADVSGHGSVVAEFSSSLRSLLRKNINQKSQKRLVERLNRQFTEMAEMRRFATALVITYLASHDRLSVCNAGHPRPLFYRAANGSGRCCPSRDGQRDVPANLPLGSRRRNPLPDVRRDARPGRPGCVLHRCPHRGSRFSGEAAGRSGFAGSRPPARPVGCAARRDRPALLEAVAGHRGHRPPMTT